jgi:hypothetical protein
MTDDVVYDDSGRPQTLREARMASDTVAGPRETVLISDGEGRWTVDGADNHGAPPRWSVREPPVVQGVKRRVPPRGHPLAPSLGRASAPAPGQAALTSLPCA